MARATATDVGYVSLDLHKRTHQDTYYFYFAPEDIELSLRTVPQVTLARRNAWMGTVISLMPKSTHFPVYLVTS